MSWTTNLLVIANRTVESDELLHTLRARCAAGSIQVTLVVATAAASATADGRTPQVHA